MGNTTEKRTVQIIMDGRQSAKTLNDLNQDIRKVTSAMRGTADAQQRLLYGSKVRELRSEYTQLNNTLLGTSRTMQNLKNTILATTVGVLGGNLLTSFQSAITGYISGTIKYMAETSDQLADLRRITGQSAEEVDNLNSSLGTLKTRTSTAELRGITIIAGRLGVAKGELLGFTAAVDKLVVSLGSELGDADQITSQLGKILNVFDGSITGDNITKLGNSFVYLANTGAATGAFIADFDQRLSGLAKSAGISLGALSGMGAGLEELGGRVESSSTAVQKILITIAQDLPKAAKIAGKSTQEFSDIFKKDATEAILLFAEGLTKNKGSFDEITATFKDAGEEGARVIETLLKLGQSSDYLRGRINDGVESIKGATQINEAFALKNETVAARLQKLGKEFARLKASPGLQDFLGSAVTGAEKMIALLKFLGHWMGVLSPFIKAAATAWAAYVVIKLRAWAIEKGYLASNIAALAIEKARNIAQLAYTLRLGLLTGRITLATVAQRAFNIVASANPFLWLPAVIVGITALINKMNQAKAARIEEETQSLADDLQKKVEAMNTVAEAITKNLDSKTVAQVNDKIAQTVAYLNKWQKAYEDAIAKKREAENEMAAFSAAKASGRTPVGSEDELKADLTRKENAAKALNIILLKFRDTKRALEEKISGDTQSSANVEVEATTEKGNELLQAQQDYLKKLEELNAEAERAGVAVIEDEMQRELAALRLAHRQKIVQITKDETEAVALAAKIGADASGVRSAASQARLGAEAEYQRARKELVKKYSDEIAETEYQQDITNLTGQYARKKLIITQLYQAGKITEQQYLDELNALELWSLQVRLQILQDYGKDATEIEQDIADKTIHINQDKSEKIKQILLAEAEMRTRLAQQAQQRAAEKGFGLGAANKDLYNAQIAQLLTQLQLQEGLTDLSEKNILDIKIKYRDQFDQLDAEYTAAERDRRKGIASFTMDQFSQLGNMIFGIRIDKLNQEMDALSAARDKEMLQLEQQKDKKLINDNDYNRRKGDIEERYKQRERALKRKQAVADKRAAIFNIALETGKNIVEAFPNIPMMILAGVMGAVQTGIVASKPIPEFGAGKRFTDTVLQGPKHASSYKGIDMIDPRTGTLVGRAEGGEVLLSAATHANNPELVNELLYNSQHHNGARIRNPSTGKEIRMAMPRFMEPRATINASALTHSVRTTTLARGGIIFPDANTSRNPSTGKEIRMAATSPADIIMGRMISVMERLESRMAEPPIAVIEYDYYTQRLRRIEEQQQNGNPGKT